MSWSEALLREFQDAKSSSLKSFRNDDSSPSPRLWKAPPVNDLRLDVDAAYNENSNNFALGGVVRNHEGGNRC